MSHFPWNLELDELEAKINEEEAELALKQKEMRKIELKEMGKATTKNMKDAAKKKAAKMN